MIRLIKLTQDGDSNFSQIVTYVKEGDICSIAESKDMTRALTEQLGENLVVSVVKLRDESGTRTMFALGHPDSILQGEHLSRRRTVLHG